MTSCQLDQILCLEGPGKTCPVHLTAASDVCHAVCAEQGALSVPLTKACVQRYESSKDALFLLPAIPGMQRPAALQVYIVAISFRFTHPNPNPYQTIKKP